MTITYIYIPIELLSLRLERTQLIILALALSFGNEGLKLSNNELSRILKVKRRNIIRAIKGLREGGHLNGECVNGRNRRLVVSGKIARMVVAQPTPPENNDSGADDTEGSGTRDTKIVAQTSPITKGTKGKLKKNLTYHQNSIEFLLSKLLFDLICYRKEDFKKPNLQTWAKHIDYLIRIDKRTPERIEDVIRWCQGDDFWQDNILSTPKLRKQFDQLELKMKKWGKNNGRYKNHQRDFSQQESQIGETIYVR